MFITSLLSLKIDLFFKVNLIVKYLISNKYRLSWEHFGGRLGESWENGKRQKNKPLAFARGVYIAVPLFFQNQTFLLKCPPLKENLLLLKYT